MAEVSSSTSADLEKLLDFNINAVSAMDGDQKTQTAAVSKFINGEISFSDYLQQMEDVTTKDEPINNSVTVPDANIDAVSVESFDQIKLSESSDSSFSDEDDDDDDDNEEESRSTVKLSRKKKRRAQKKSHKSKLSPTLRAVMGQANVCYAKGDSESAVKMCLEIIKEEPKASEPFRTLSSIYEGIGQPEKSLQMRLIAAHLGPTDKEEWIQLANILEGTEQFRQAVSCLTRAISADPVNVPLYEKRVELMKKARLGCSEDYGYHRLLRKLNPKTDGQTVVRIRTLVGTSYYKDKKYEKACEIWKYVFDVCEQYVTAEEVERYTDALVCAKSYDEFLSILVKYCKISVTKKIVDDEEVVTDVNIPTATSPNVRLKLVLCLIYYRAFDFVKQQIEVLLNDDPDDCGQLYYDVTVSLIEAKRFEDVLPMLKRLTESKMNSPDIWFKITSCYRQLNAVDECFASYRSAIQTFPENNELKLKFCDELKVAGLYSEAVQITLENEASISSLIYERCQLYYLMEDFDAFIDAALQLFRLHFIEINSPEEFVLFDSLLRTVHKGMREKLSPYLKVDVDHTVTVEEEWEIFLKVCKLYVERKYYDLFQWLAFSMWLSFKFVPKRAELRLVMSVAAILNEDYESGYDLTRNFLMQSEVADRPWNLFYLATYRCDYSRLHKFLIRYLIKNPKQRHALTMYANGCLFAGTYKYALNDYTILYEEQKNPMLALLIALNLLHISCQKYVTSKHMLVTQMIAFLTKYQELRGSEADQETFYNIGRAFHQIELLPQAVFYYKKALSCKPAIDHSMFDLTSDIAFNLHLIYRNSGQDAVANSYLQKYIVI